MYLSLSHLLSQRHIQNNSNRMSRDKYSVKEVQLNEKGTQKSEGTRTGHATHVPTNGRRPVQIKPIKAQEAQARKAEGS